MSSIDRVERSIGEDDHQSRQLAAVAIWRRFSAKVASS